MLGVRFSIGPDNLRALAPNGRPPPYEGVGCQRTAKDAPGMLACPLFWPVFLASLVEDTRGVRIRVKKDNKPPVTALEVSLRVVIGMIEVLLPVYASLFFLCVFVWISISSLKATLTALGNQLQTNTVEIPPSFVEELKEEMFDIVQDTVQNMQPPNAADHLMGALSQMVQMKMMKAMNLGDALPAIGQAINGAVPPGVEDGV